MIKKLLPFSFLLITGLPFLVSSQAKKVEKITKKADEIVIPYEKYIFYTCF